MKLPLMIRESITHIAGYRDMEDSNRDPDKNRAAGTYWWYVRPEAREEVHALLQLLKVSIDECWYWHPEQGAWDSTRAQINVIHIKLHLQNRTPE